MIKKLKGAGLGWREDDTSIATEKLGLIASPLYYFYVLLLL